MKEKKNCLAYSVTDRGSPPFGPQFQPISPSFAISIT